MFLKSTVTSGNTIAVTAIAEAKMLLTMSEWCRENCNDYMGHTYSGEEKKLAKSKGFNIFSMFYFGKKDDAALFVLKFK